MSLNEINIGPSWMNTLKLGEKNNELFSVYKAGLPIVADHFNRAIHSLNKNEKDEVVIADFGGASGDITDYLRKENSINNSMTIECIDINEELLKQNISCDVVIMADLREFKIEKKYDIGIMRYVLQYNTKKDQLKILENIFSSLKENGQFINHWCGVFSTVQQKKFQELFTTKNISEKLYRPNSYWSTWNETKSLFKDANFDIQNLTHFSFPLNELYKIRYNLTEEENMRLLAFLGEHTFIKYTIFTAIPQPRV